MKWLLGTVHRSVIRGSVIGPEAGNPRKYAARSAKSEKNWSGCKLNDRSCRSHEGMPYWASRFNGLRWIAWRDRGFRRLGSLSLSFLAGTEYFLELGSLNKHLSLLERYATLHVAFFLSTYRTAGVFVAIHGTEAYHSRVRHAAFQSQEFFLAIPGVAIGAAGSVWAYPNVSFGYVKWRVWRLADAATERFCYIQSSQLKWGESSNGNALEQHRLA